MSITDKLIPDKILGDNKFRNEYTRRAAKSDIFVRLFGIDPDKDPAKGHGVTYDENGHANSPFYRGEELTKEEIYERLCKKGIVKSGIKGRTHTEVLLNCAFPDRSYMGYEFEKVKDIKGNIKYRLQWRDFVGL